MAVCFLFLTLFDQFYLGNTFELRPVTVVLQRPRQEDYEFETNLVYMGRPYLNNKNNTFVLYFGLVSCGLLPVVLQSSGTAVVWIDL